MSAFNVIPRKASESEIASWASTCTPSITGALASMDDMSEVGNVTAIIPSTCDGKFLSCLNCSLFYLILNLDMRKLLNNKGARNSLYKYMHH